MFNVFKNPKKDLAIAFINEIEILALKMDYGIIHRNSTGYESDVKACLEHIVKDSRELIEYNEWGIAIENALVNLYEIDFKLDAAILNPITELFSFPSHESYLEIIQELKK